MRILSRVLRPCSARFFSARPALRSGITKQISHNDTHQDDILISQRLQNLRQRNIKPFSDFLTDNFHRQHDYLRISITERCNLRCVYCMPEEGVDLSPDEKLLTTDEIVRIASLFVSQGVTKIRLTGGEPTVRKDIVELVSRLHKLDGLKEICITSNGIALHRKLPELFANGLTALNLSLDTLIEGKFLLITRRNGLNAVMKSLNKALELQIPKVKINVVIMKGMNEDEILNFVELTKNAPIEVRFIEYMPFGGNKWSNEKMVTYEDILSNIKVKYPQIHRISHKHGDTAKVFQIEGFRGKLGFITSMTENFCSTCTRLRITNDGNLKVCLFGNEEVNLKDLIREGSKDEELLQVIGKAVKRKKEKHAGLGELENLPNRPMILIDNLRKSLQDQRNWNFNQIRNFSSTTRSHTKKLTHVNTKGEANMVDVHAKPVTRRRAVAVGQIKFSNQDSIELIKSDSNKKGDVLSVSRISAIMAVKKTSDLIPLCHPLQITKVSVEFNVLPLDNAISVECVVECDGKTGVEMELLCGANIGLLTIYDMCKAVDKYMIIKDVKVLHKSGGKSGEFNLN